MEPTFDVSEENVTVLVGKMAILPCSISNQGDYKVCMSGPAEHICKDTTW